MYIYQNESRWRLLARTGQVITLRGIKPEGVYQLGTTKLLALGLGGSTER